MARNFIFSSAKLSLCVVDLYQITKFAHIYLTGPNGNATKPLCKSRSQTTLV
jgi:hypothetical protein